MTTYKIVTPQLTFELDVSGSLITGSRPDFGVVGVQFSLLRDQLLRKGWSIVPVIEEEHPHWLEYRGDLYEFHWQNDQLVRITHHQDGVPNDILFEQLPLPLQHLL